MAKYYYNEVLLPKIPVVDGYPYGVLIQSTTEPIYRLTLSTNKYFYQSSDNTFRPGTNTVKNYWLTSEEASTGTDWVTRNETVYYHEGKKVFWSNYDIPKDSITSAYIYFSARPVMPEGYKTILVQSIEAETGTLAGGAVIKDRTGLSNNTVVDMVTPSGGTLTLNFNANKDGFYHIDMLYTCGDTRSFIATIGGKSYIHTVNGKSFYDVEHYAFELFFTAGPNEVVFSGYQTTYAPMFDRFDVYEYASFDIRYLIRSGSTLYTVTDGALTALAETTLTADLFRASGVEAIPDSSLLVGLTDPEVLCWQDSVEYRPYVTMTVKGTPPLPQIVTSKPMDLTHESIAGIDYVVVEASEDVRFSVSFDGGTTWKAFDGSSWFETSDGSPGMLASTMNTITAQQWAEIATLESYMVRLWIPNTTAYVKSVVFHYINP